MENISIAAANRDALPQVINDMALTGFGVEVGVQKGIFSKHLLTHTKLEKLFLVDAWRKIPKDYNDIANVGPWGHAQAMLQTFLQVYNFGPRAVMIREESGDASELFPDGSLDFVYLDADHSYEGCMRDLELWYPKMRPGGLFSGHDFIDSPREMNTAADFGVASAVMEYAEARKLVVERTGEEFGDCPSWLIRVPCIPATTLPESDMKQVK